MKNLTLCFALITLLSVPGKLLAANGADSFSGLVGFGAMVIDSGNNLNPNGSEKRLDNLNSSPERNTTFIPVILPRLHWDIGQQEGVKLYFVTDPPIDEVGGFALNLGATYSIPEIGTLDGAVFFTPFEEAWENPYVTGVDREETDTAKYGVKIGLNRIMGTGLRVNFIYLNDDVDNDLIGAITPELARDGAIYALNMNYSFYPSETLEIRPRFSIRKGDYDGEANSFTKYKFEVEARYRVGQLMITPRVHYSHSDFDEENPVFNEKRENDSYGFSLMTTYMQPFDWQNWSVMGLLSISKGDSNITFYDTEAITLGAVLNYHF